MVQPSTLTGWLSRGMALAILAAGSHAAMAQMQPEARLGSRIPVKPETASEDQTHKVVRAYATCVVANQRALASQFVLDRTRLGLGDKFRPLADGNCLLEASGASFADVALRTWGDSMRFAFAEALLRDEIGTIDPAQLPAAPKLQVPLLNAADYEPRTERPYTADDLKTLDEKRQRDMTSIVMYRLGDCVVRSDPQNARALLQASAGSDAEGGAFQALMPALGACLEKGAQLKLDRAALRGAVAFGYYSLAHAAPQVASAERKP